MKKIIIKIIECFVILLGCCFVILPEVIAHYLFDFIDYVKGDKDEYTIKGGE